jgi:hypothetical protein
LSETSICLRLRPFGGESSGSSGRENNHHHLERKRIKGSNRDRLLVGTVLTTRHGFDANVAFTEAFEDMYAFTAVNPGVPAKFQYVGRRCPCALLY